MENDEFLEFCGKGSASGTPKLTRLEELAEAKASMGKAKLARAKAVAEIVVRDVLRTEARADRIIIRAEDESGDKLKISIRPTTLLGKLASTYCYVQGLAMPGQMRFSFGGREVMELICFSFGGREVMALDTCASVRRVSPLSSAFDGTDPRDAARHQGWRYLDGGPSSTRRGRRRERRKTRAWTIRLWRLH